MKQFCRVIRSGFPFSILFLAVFAAQVQAGENVEKDGYLETVSSRLEGVRESAIKGSTTLLLKKVCGTQYEGAEERLSRYLSAEPMGSLSFGTKSNDLWIEELFYQCENKQYVRTVWSRINAEVSSAANDILKVITDYIYTGENLSKSLDDLLEKAETTLKVQISLKLSALTLLERIETELNVERRAQAGSSGEVKKKRCFCGRKLSIVSHCSCGGDFCNTHRLPENHSCTFNWRALGQELIRRDNPQVIAPKFEKL